jgi:hypothetical protein
VFAGRVLLLAVAVADLALQGLFTRFLGSSGYGYDYAERHNQSNDTSHNALQSTNSPRVKELARQQYTPEGS